MTRRVLGISGSLRAGAFNTLLLRAAARELPQGVTLDLYEGLRAIPPLDQDDVDAPPQPVLELRAAVATADAVLFATPEYNHSVSGVLKNAVDWISRPVGQSVLKGKPVAVVGASAGQFGAVWAQAELRKVLESCGAEVLEGELAVGSARERFDADGTLTDSELREQLRSHVSALLDVAANAGSDGGAA